MTGPPRPRTPCKSAWSVSHTPTSVVAPSALSSAAAFGRARVPARNPSAMLLSSRAGSYAKHGPDYMSWSLLADAAVGAVVAAVAVAACPAAAPAACATAAAATVLTCRACGVRLGQLATKTYTVGAHYVQMHAGMAYMYIVHTCSRCNTAEVQLKKGACRRRAPPTPRTPRSLTL